MSTFFIADLHLGHKSMAIKRGFSSTFEHDEHLIKQWNKVVSKKDKVFILGDVSMESHNWYFYLDQMNGFKSVVLGNHDLPQHIPELLKYVEHISGMVKYSTANFPKIFLTHCPIHTRELDYRVKYNIHGHIHEYNVMRTEIIGKYGHTREVKDDRYINVSCEQIDYTPKKIEQLIKLR